jgi:putative transposase
LSIPMQMGTYQRVQWHRTRGQADLVLVNNVVYLLIMVEHPRNLSGPLVKTNPNRI